MPIIMIRPWNCDSVVVLLLSATLLLSHFADADLYLHVPRGSNNRLNEKSANRDNADRLFDSQNNNRGGYNAGDKLDKAAGNNEEDQYRMSYFQSSQSHRVQTDGAGSTYLTVEWTSQHGCGGNEDTDPHKLNCNMVLQYMCQDDVPKATGENSEKATTLRNGVNRDTQNYNQPQNLNVGPGNTNNRRNQVNIQRGLHEPWSWYDKCYVRERNRGLFTADQILKSDNDLGYSSAIYTRQNPNGNRRGYECPEERDYYPYWHPTPWTDIAVLAENASICSHYQSKSFNVQPYHECLEMYPGTNELRHYSRWNNESACETNGGQWLLLHSYLEKAPAYTRAGACERANSNTLGIRYKWAIPHDTTTGSAECLVELDMPHCEEAAWSRSNHLGNGRDGKANTYTWTLPHFPSGNTKRCAFRMRYNISTDDYDPYSTTSTHNDDKMKGISSPVQQNPYIDIGAGSSPLRLAINTAQLGRTFQDRSHIFKLVPRPSGLDSRRIYNLNVRGKRGNIVQVYPAVEYDFAPNTLNIREDDLVLIQWTGSNTHNNGQPAGDGQAGDAGEGKSGTDRSNMVEIPDMNSNYPLPMENSDMFTNAQVHWIYNGKDMSGPDLMINVASSGYYQCMTGCAERPGNKAKMNNLLDNAPASYQGVLLQFSKGVHHYMCTRNNNFTNRSQKAKIVVS